MARDSFLLRIDPKVMAAIRRWAEDDLRSVNGQIEYLLLRAAREAGRLKPANNPTVSQDDKSPNE